MTEQNTMTLVRAFAEIIERQVTRFEHQGAEYERKLAEHRTSFGARTEADAKIIAGLRAEIVVLRAEVAQRQSTLNALQGKIREMAESLGKSLDERDALRAELARLKSQTPKHPVKVGEWAKRIKLHPDGTPAGSVQQVRAILPAGYEMKSGSIWAVDYCEPCDPPATHDTEAGKAVAESAVKTEPVAEEIKVGDMAKVVGASGDLTAQSDIGKIGEVLKIDSQDGTVRLSGAAGWVDQCDVRKVTT